MKNEMWDRCLTLFTKPATPGRVKTRLIGELTPDQAAELHAAFRDDLLEGLIRGEYELRIAWDLLDDEPLPGAPVPGFRQIGSDLGERLFRALEEAGGSFSTVAAVGSDHPLLRRQAVEEAFERVESGSDVVLGPAHDGGYYLIAVRSERLDRRLFDGIPWSGPRVLAETVARCHELGFEPALLAEAADVDTPDDLEELIGNLAASPLPPCPRTRGLLSSWGRLNGGGGR